MQLEDSCIEQLLKNGKSITGGTGDGSKIYLSCYNNDNVILKVINSKYNTYNNDKNINLKINYVDWKPKLIGFNDNKKALLFEYCGERLSITNRPSNYKKQVALILDEMNAIGLRHNDMKYEDVLVNNGKIYICDYGWATIGNQKFIKPPHPHIFENSNLEHLLENIGKYNGKHLIEFRNRGKNASQSEIPRLYNYGSLYTILGYQTYKISKLNVYPISKQNKYQGLKEILKIIKLDCTSLSDIGCSNGLVGLMSNYMGYNVNCYDHDEGCISLINTIINNYNIENINVNKYSFGDDIESADVTVMLALIHWVYSYTAKYGNFSDIMKYIKSITNKYAIIEWVNNNDQAIKCANHIGKNTEIQTEQYNLQNFEKSLSIIGNVVKVFDYMDTRQIYVIQCS